jgi:hypothetical protein
MDVLSSNSKQDSKELQTEGIFRALAFVRLYPSKSFPRMRFERLPCRRRGAIPRHTITNNSRFRPLCMVSFLHNCEK